MNSGTTKPRQRTEEDGDADVHQRIGGAVEEVAPQRRKIGGLAKAGKPLEVVRQPVDGDRLDFFLRRERGGHHEPDREGEQDRGGERDQKQHRTFADAAPVHVRPFGD
jgi:hypothetical protein